MVRLPVTSFFSRPDSSRPEATATALAGRHAAIAAIAGQGSPMAADDPPAVHRQKQSVGIFTGKDSADPVIGLQFEPICFVPGRSPPLALPPAREPEGGKWVSPLVFDWPAPWAQSESDRKK